MGNSLRPGFVLPMPPAIRSVQPPTFNGQTVAPGKTFDIFRRLTPDQKKVLETGARLLKAVVSPIVPTFLLSNKATQTFIDSVKHALQHDVATGLVEDHFLWASNMANLVLDEQAANQFSERAIRSRIDLINLAWEDITRTVSNSLLGDIEADASLAAMPAISRQIFSLIEMKAAGALVHGTSFPKDEKFLIFNALAALTYGENQGDRNAVFFAGKNQAPSSASGIWATTKAADIDGVKFTSQMVDMSVISSAARSYNAALPSDAKFGWSKVAAGVGIVLSHHKRILKEWSWNGARWAPNFPRLAAAAHRYATLLDDKELGYVWLQTLYHINNAAKVMSTALDKDRISKDLGFAALAFDNERHVLDYFDSLRIQGSDASKASSITHAEALKSGFAGRYEADLAASSAQFAYTSRHIIVSRPALRRRYFNKKKNRWYDRPHKGVDLNARNQPLFAAADGIITAVGYDAAGWGYWVELTSQKNGAVYKYAHLTKYLFDKKQLPKSVLRGEAIGISGASGNAEGPHLHFEYYPLISQGGKLVKGPWADPLKDPHEGWKYTYIQKH